MGKRGEMLNVYVSIGEFNDAIKTASQNQFSIWSASK